MARWFRLFREVLICLAGFILLLVFMLLVSHAAMAQAGPGAQCGARDNVTSHLESKYGEVRQGMGIAANNTVMELWASAGSGTWTITLTMPTGLTCLVASGQGFEALTEALPPPGDDL